MSRFLTPAANRASSVVGKGAAALAMLGIGDLSGAASNCSSVGAASRETIACNHPETFLSHIGARMMASLTFDVLLREQLERWSMDAGERGRGCAEQNETRGCADETGRAVAQTKWDARLRKTKWMCTRPKLVDVPGLPKPPMIR